MTRTLCLNCDNSDVCLWKSDDVILCNEYTLQPIIEVNHSPPITTQNRIKNGSNSLCFSCDRNQQCLFQDQKLNTIFCEEFQ